mmetsp:Transcript_2730/g.3219  ORF Transcript_2730/g.3219 Transcript_2730/m.3219 type:complete len:112 (+) Transcript_2730:233-568(+)
MSGPAPVQRTALQLYRDCLRLVKHIAPGKSPKGLALRAMVNSEFGKNKHEKDEAKIEIMKAGAIRALSNYLLYESGAKDNKLGKAMNNYNEASRKEIDSETTDLKNGDKKA